MAPHTPPLHPELWTIHETGEPTYRYQVRYIQAGIAVFCYRGDAEAFIRAAIEHALGVGAAEIAQRFPSGGTGAA